MKEELINVVREIRNIIECYKEIDLMPLISAETARYLRGETEMEHKILDSINDLGKLRNHIGDCIRCKLHVNRQNIVFGEGDPDAELVFIGEAPGREEDMEGRPFVGEAGRLLTRIIKAMGLDRGDVYICNIVKCRPPRNRDPEPDEIEACLPFLKAQIRIIQPKVICTLGRIAAQSLLGKDFKITRQRGDWHSYMGIPLMPTFHPAYLLRNPSQKRVVWEDIKKIMERLGLNDKNM